LQVEQVKRIWLLVGPDIQIGTAVVAIGAITEHGELTDELM
jgi:hypothetical protein